MRSKSIWIKTYGGNKGGALLVCTFLISVTMALIFGFAFISNWIQGEQNLFKICYKIQTKTFAANKRRLQYLLDLNPIAQNLRLDHQRISFSLAAAILQKNPILVLKYQKLLQENLRRRKKLDGIQKNYLSLANIDFQRSHIQLQRKILALINEKSEQKSLIKNNINLQRSQAPELAVLPEDSDLAPVYELKKHFEKSQAWSVTWMQSMETLNSQDLIRLQFKGNKQCSTTLKEISPERFDIIPADRFL